MEVSECANCIMSKKPRQRGLFDIDNHAASVLKRNRVLLDLSQMVNWELFRSLVEASAPVSSRGLGGRPSYDRVLLFKILILQQLYNLSDAQMEFQIHDRTSFRLFLGLELHDAVPDEKTIWLFREQLKSSGAHDKAFELWSRELRRRGIKASKGTIVDATIVEVPAPAQRVSTIEPDAATTTAAPSPERPAQVRQKDADATKMFKGGRWYYGYKNHIIIDEVSGLIEGYVVTTAKVGDNQGLELIFASSWTKNNPQRGRSILGDKGYDSRECRRLVKQHKMNDELMLTRRNNKDAPESIVKEKRNQQISKRRRRVEHVFAWMKRQMKVFDVRCRGIGRVQSNIALQNLTYNLFKGCQILQSSALT